MRVFILILPLLFAAFCGERNENPNLVLSAVETQRALRGNALLIDLRAKGDYERRHVCGALHVTLFRADAPSADQYVVVYGSGERDGSETRAFVRALRRLGYTKAFAVEGGFPALLKADFKLSAATFAAAAYSF